VRRATFSVMRRTGTAGLWASAALAEFSDSDLPVLGLRWVERALAADMRALCCAVADTDASVEASFCSAARRRVSSRAVVRGDGLTTATAFFATRAANAVSGAFFATRVATDLATALSVAVLLAVPFAGEGPLLTATAPAGAVLGGAGRALCWLDLLSLVDSGAGLA